MYLLSSDNMFLFRLFGSTGYCAACKKIIPAFEMVRINDDDDDMMMMIMMMMMMMMMIIMT